MNESNATQPTNTDEPEEVTTPFSGLTREDFIVEISKPRCFGKFAEKKQTVAAIVNKKEDPLKITNL